MLFADNSRSNHDVAKGAMRCLVLRIHCAIHPTASCIGVLRLWLDHWISQLMSQSHLSRNQKEASPINADISTHNWSSIVNTCCGLKQSIVITTFMFLMQFLTREVEVRARAAICSQS